MSVKNTLTHLWVRHHPSLQALHTQVKDVLLKAVVLLHLLHHDGNFGSSSVNLFKLMIIGIKYSRGLGVGPGSAAERWPGPKLDTNFTFILYKGCPSSDVLVFLWMLALKSSFILPVNKSKIANCRGRPL